jgi:DNA polymerase-3 subunit gamma/tau
VFENIIGQGAALQLRDDILSRRQAPSMLFFGPSESGKGSAALELARVLSCEGDASWKCACPACDRHRYLRHGDLLMLGIRRFSAEIAASCAAFLRDPDSPSPAKTLFIRCLGKLQARFSPVLMESDPKLSKVSPILQSLDEGLNELDAAQQTAAQLATLEKICGSLVKDALKLEDEGMGDTIPINHIRRAAYWCRLAPVGKRKTLLIENAERMRDEARNSLLKLLEEPPDTVSIVLTAQRREAIMPTILSRVRPYRFLKRDAELETEVIQRVFREKPDYASANAASVAAGGSLISAYLDSFLPNNIDNLRPLAAYFLVSMARMAILSLKKNRAPLPDIANALGERYAPVADAAGFGRSTTASVVIKTLLAKSGNFEDVSFSRFLKTILDMVSEVTREDASPRHIAYVDAFKKHISEAETAANILNQSAALALEALFSKMKTSLQGGFNE